MRASPRPIAAAETDALQRPLPDGSLHVVAEGETFDGTISEMGMIPAGSGPA